MTPVKLVELIFVIAAILLVVGFFAGKWSWGGGGATALLAITILLMLLVPGGCGARNLVLDADDAAPTFDIQRGPPCRMAMAGDGEVQATITHATQRCRLVIDGVEVP